MTATRGLEGIVAAESKISSIIDDTLTYVGYNIDDLAENASFEEVVYLIMAHSSTKCRRISGIKETISRKC